MRLVVLGVGVSLILASFLRFRSLLHPHVVFSVMLFVLFGSDYVVKGFEDDPWVAPISEHKLVEFQLYVIAVQVFVFLATWMRATSTNAFRVDFVRVSRSSPLALAAINVGCGAILVGELVKRLSSTGWSLSEMITESMSARGSATWSVASFQESNALYALLDSLYPLAGVGFAFFFWQNRDVQRWGNLVGVVLVLLLLFGRGSRTPVALVIGSFVVFACLFQRSLGARITTVVVSAVLAVMIFSAQITFRSAGLGTMFTERGADQVGLVYHQDNNYSMVLHAMNHAEVTGARWSAAEFFSSIVVNPIPRAIWPGKPKLDQFFYGYFKPEWYTNGYIGEAVAMFGPLGGAAFAVAFGFLWYCALERTLPILRRPLGIAFYIVFLVYTYMVIRSMLNITAWIYAPAGAFLFVRFATMFQQTLQPSSSGATLAAPVARFRSHEHRL